MLQGIHVANSRLVEQILKCTPVVQAAAYLCNEFVGNVHSKTTAFNPTVKHMAKVLFTVEASSAVLSNAARTAKTQRSQSRWPQAGNLFMKPIRDIRGEFFFGWHAVYVISYHMYSQANSFNCFLCNNL